LLLGKDFRSASESPLLDVVLGHLLILPGLLRGLHRIVVFGYLLKVRFPFVLFLVGTAHTLGLWHPDAV
jgi:hypothetical protein